MAVPCGIHSGVSEGFVRDSLGDPFLGTLFGDQEEDRWCTLRSIQGILCGKQQELPGVISNLYQLHRAIEEKSKSDTRRFILYIPIDPFAP